MFNFEVGMKELLLVRHGESQYNAYLTDHLDSELTQKGIDQAHATGKFLKDHFGHIQHFVGLTSPYHRCLQTSRILNEYLNIEFTVTPGPREIMTKYDICTVNHRKHLFPDFVWQHDDHLVFERENDEEFINRMRAFHGTISHEKVLIVTHGTPVNTLYECELGLIPSADTVNFVKNCALSYARNGEGVWFGKTVYE